MFNFRGKKSGDGENPSSDAQQRPDRAESLMRELAMEHPELAPDLGDFENFIKASINKDPDSMYAVGIDLLFGANNIQQDVTSGMGWLHNAADSYEHVGAMVVLGDSYLAGNLVQQDTAQAYRYFNLAAEAGSTDAMRGLALMYGAGNGVPKDPAKRYEWLKKAIDAGDGSAMASLAKDFQHGRGGREQDYEKAARLFEKAAEMGSDYGQLMVGVVNLEGVGSIKADLTRARECFQAGVDKGCPGAMVELAMMKILHPAPGDTRDQVVSLLEKAGEAGDMRAYRKLGDLFENGHGEQPDPKRAVDYYMKGMDTYDDIFCANRAADVLTRFGQGHGAFEMAENLWKGGADRGDLEAKARYGGMLVGRGEFEQGYAQVKESAERGNPSGLKVLSVIYRMGQGTPVNLELAERYDRMAEEAFKAMPRNDPEPFTGELYI